MTLQLKWFFRRGLRLELTAESLKCERRTLTGAHEFEAPLNEVSSTTERVRSTASGSYFAAGCCFILAGLQLHPLEEIWMMTWVFAGALAVVGAYFTVVARMNSGDYIVLRSTKESSRDIWIRRNGHETEVDQFVETLRARLLQPKTGTR